MLYHWLGWLSLIICILLLMKYIGRISKVKRFNQMLRKIHEPCGLAVIGVSALHGILSLVKSANAFIENTSGIILFLLIVLLARTFYAKKTLKAKWFQMHRHLAITLIFIISVHVIVSIS